MVSNKQWTPEQDEKLIALLREFPLLWDTNYAEYTNRAMREANWKLLEEKMNLAIFELGDLKARLYYYRRKFCEEYNKMLKNSFYTTTFELFNALEFLFKLKTIDNRNEVQNINTEEAEEVQSSGEDNSEQQRAQTVPPKDEFTIFGENIAKELFAMKEYTSIKLDFKYKVMAAILEANEALMQIRKKT